jgi:hypothetical protein
MDLTPIVGDALIDPIPLARPPAPRAASIGRIDLITNGILLDKHGVDAVSTAA